MHICYNLIIIDAFVILEVVIVSIYCPIVDRNVTYQFCEGCDDKECRYPHADIFEQEGSDKNRNSNK